MKLLPPVDFTEANIEGAIYRADDDGLVEVQVPAHVQHLRDVGFTDPDAPRAAAPAAAPAAPADAPATEAAPAAPAAPMTVRVASLYPGLNEALTGAGVAFAEDLTPTDLLALVEDTVAEQGGFAAEEKEPYSFARADFPFVSACMADAGVENLADLDAVFRAIEDRAPTDAFNPDGSRKEFVIGEFVQRALAAAGLTDISDTQAVLDAVEEAFEPFSAFDPNGDGKPGGPAAPAADSADDDGLGALKADEIKDRLTKMEVEFAAGTAKPILLQLLRDSLAAQAAAASQRSADDAGGQ